jgi:hypothetical protein
MYIRSGMYGVHQCILVLSPDHSRLSEVQHNDSLLFHSVPLLIHLLAIFCFALFQ